MNEPCVIVDCGASVPKINPPEKEKIVSKTSLQLLAIVMGSILLIMVFLTLGYNLAYFYFCKA